MRADRTWARADSEHRFLDSLRAWSVPELGPKPLGYFPFDEDTLGGWLEPKTEFDPSVFNDTYEIDMYLDDPCWGLYWELSSGDFIFESEPRVELVDGREPLRDSRHWGYEPDLQFWTYFDEEVRPGDTVYITIRRLSDGHLFNFTFRCMSESNMRM